MRGCLVIVLCFVLAACATSQPSALEDLAHIQGQLYRDTKPPLSEEETVDRIRALASRWPEHAELLEDFVREGFPEGSTTYQEPVPWLLLTLVREELRQVPRFSECDIDSLAFGTAPSLIANAVTLLGPRSGEPLVLVNEGLFYFFYRMIKLFVLEATGAGGSETKELDERVRPFVVVLGEYVGLFEPEERFAPPDSFGALSAVAVLSKSAEAFVVAHEEAHACLGHLGEAVSGELFAGGDCENKIPVHMIVRHWTDELEADYYAARAAARLAEIGHERAGEVSVWGGELALILLELSARALRVRCGDDAGELFPELVSGVDEERVYQCLRKSSFSRQCVKQVVAGLAQGGYGATHPPFQLRRATVRAALGQKLEEEEDLGRIFGRSMEIVWAHAAHFMMWLRAEGQIP